MSLFIAQLAFTTSPMLYEEARLGIIMASVTAAIVGLTWLYLSSRKSMITPFTFNKKKDAEGG